MASARSAGTTPRRLVAVVLALAAFSALAFGLAGAQPRGAPLPPTPPRVLLDTTYLPPSGRTIAVGPGGDLQAALNAAQPGDVVSLAAGEVFRGNFRLPRKTGAGWIVVRSAAPDQQLPGPGTRVTPAFAPAMPKIVSPNSGPAVYTDPGAHHYRLIGIELTADASVNTIYSIVALGGDQTTDADTPHHLILDRCYVHGHPGLTSLRGVLLNGGATAVIDSHVAQIHAAGYDSQAVLGYNGPGPFKIVNNFLEGAAENVMFGGADPRIHGLVPSDIEIRRNHLYKPPSWRPGHPSYAGVQWTVKNLLELKNAQRVVIEDNLLENMWGTALVLTPRNQDGTAPWSVVQDVLVRNNVIRNAMSGFSVQTADDLRPSQPSKRIAIINNLWVGLTRTFFGITGGRGPALEDLIIDHNTAVPGGYSTYYVEVAAPPAVVRFQLTNNVMGFGAYGVTFPMADQNFSTWLPGAVVARNALVSLGDTGDGQGGTRNHPHYVSPGLYASFPSSAAAGIAVDGRLAPKSPLRRAGVDGKDVGVDFDRLAPARDDQAPRK